MKLNKLAVGVIGREKFCGQVLKSKRFKSYDINCLTMQKSSFENEADMIDKVLANQALEENLLQTDMTDMGTSLVCVEDTC